MLTGQQDGVVPVVGIDHLETGLHQRDEQGYAGARDNWAQIEYELPGIANGVEQRRERARRRGRENIAFASSAASLFALLATFYGASVANLVCLPLADKLHLKLVDEEINRTLIIDGVLMIRENKSPAVIRDMLISYLPSKARADMQEAA